MTPVADADARRRHRLGLALALLSVLLLVAALAAGSDGWSPRALQALLAGPDATLIVGRIRAPRALGAWLVGALLGLAGAIAQGLFRNPLADPYLLGSASGASLGVVMLLAGASLAGSAIGVEAAGLLARGGIVVVAFVGAWCGIALTLALSRGARETTRLLLAGVVVGVLLSAVSDLITSAAPDALRGKQAFLLGNTGYLGWQSCAALAAGLVVALPIAWRLARGLDALTLGEDTARSLGLALGPVRMALVATLALATGLAVSQAGLVAFVGLVAPHLVRRQAPAPHGYTLVASTAAGGCLLLAADILARCMIAPQELPVGVLTAVLGGIYLLWLLHRRRIA
ncbi:MAG: iron ABC transporter permease [Proteobacteria bacterium]|nr:iron ABC transporter permease [Pseudomonadota bacterium]